MDTTATIRPIIEDTYGKDALSDTLIKSLVHKIETFEAEDHDSYYGRSRENIVRETCWLFFSGGSTAASVARHIEEALS